MDFRQRERMITDKAYGASDPPLKRPLAGSFGKV
jgi:hypothetical protein